MHPSVEVLSHTHLDCTLLFPHAFQPALNQKNSTHLTSLSLLLYFTFYHHVSSRIFSHPISFLSIVDGVILKLVLFLLREGG